MGDWAFSSATDLAKAIKGKRLGCLELLDIYRERYERFNPRINAIVATDFERAAARARAADEALARGEIWGPLHGIPMTVKDSIEVMGMPCTSGSKELKGYIPTRNAEVISSLLDAGAIIFGKTNLPLFGLDFQTYNDLYGQTNNPWDLSRVPGGSSGGAAAALAAGLTALEIGSDIGGSLRNPAHFCGIYAHKPTFAIVPFCGHIPPLPGLCPEDYAIPLDIAVLGPLARGAVDLELVMGIIAQPERSNRVAWHLELPPPRKNGLREYRVGLWLDDAAFPVDSAVRDCLQDLVDLLVKEGVSLEDRHPDIDLSASHDIYVRLMTAVTTVTLPEEVLGRLQTEASSISADDKGFRAQMLRGATMSHREWLGLDYARQLLRQKWADFFKEFDILLCPVAPVTAFPHDQSDFFGRTLTINNAKVPYPDAMAGWAGLTCVSYLPVTVAPAGLTKDGLPAGVQIVGPYLEDRTTIHFARLLEELTGGFTPPPGYE